MRSTVVLPQPDGPSSDSNSPRFTCEADRADDGLRRVPAGQPVELKLVHATRQEVAAW